MANLNVETNKIREAGSTIVDLSFDFIRLVNDFYNRINVIPSITNEWVGHESVNYVKMCMSEKENYFRYANSLKTLGNCLLEFSDKLDELAKEVEDDL